MKLLIASDIHGSQFYAQKIKELSQNFDRTILLGDIYNHGPRNPFPKDYAPMQVAETLNSIKEKLVVIKGNCDSEVDQMISEFNFHQNYELESDRELFFTHGHIFNLDNVPNLPKGSVVFHGHFHIPFIKEKNGIIVVNVGSVALPKENHPNTYATYENGKISILNFDNEIILELQLA